MITEPWRIGPDDYVRASGLEIEFDPAKHPRQIGDARATWFASYTRLKQEWRSRIVAALDAGTIAIETEGLHIDALGLIHTELSARRKRIETARRAELEATNTYDTVEQLNEGDRPWCRRFHERVLVIRKHRSSVEVKTSRNNIFKIPLAERSLRRLTPAEVEAEVRKPVQTVAAAAPQAEAPRAPTTETTPADAPPANNATGSEIVKSESEGPETTETIDATEIRVEVIDADNRLVRIGPTLSIQMRVDFADGEARALDEDVARALGYVRLTDIRELIKRMIKGGKLHDVHQVRAVRKWEGQVAPRAVTEHWLTEREILLVATQSETKDAWKLTTLIVDVFRAVTRGEVRPQPTPAALATAPAFSMQEMSVAIASAVSAAMMPVVETLRAEIRDIDRRISPPAQLAAPAPAPSATITDLTAGTRYAREITGRITRAAHTAVAADMGTFGKLRKAFEDRVRAAIGFPRASAHRWENLPMSRLEEARLAVAQIEAEVRTQAEKRFASSQLRLIPGGAT